MGGPTRLKLVSLGAGAQAGTVRNSPSRSALPGPALAVLVTCAIGFLLPPIAPKYSGALYGAHQGRQKLLPRTIVADLPTSFDLFFCPF